MDAPATSTILQLLTLLLAVGWAVRVAAFGPLGVAVTLQFATLLVGTAVTPLVYSFHLAPFGFEGLSYLERSGGHVDAWTSLAALLFWASLGLGTAFSWSTKAKAPQPTNTDPQEEARLRLVAWITLVASVAAYSALFYFVDWNTLLSESRFGSAEAYGAEQRFLFLKSFATVGMYAICFWPVFSNARRSERWAFLSLFAVYVATTYATQISRNFLLQGVFIPVLVLVLRERTGRGFVRLVPATTTVALLAAVVLIYGKSYGMFQREYVLTGQLTGLEAYQSDNPFVALVNNTEFLWFSIDAGIASHLQHAAIIAKEYVIAAAFGMVPSRILDGLGLGQLAYQGMLSDGAFGINTRAFGLPGATVPVGLIGFSVYSLSIIGPVAAGILSGALLRKLIDRGRGANASGFVRAWIAVGIAGQYLVMIPMSAALAGFSLVFLILTDRVVALVARPTEPLDHRRPLAAAVLRGPRSTGRGAPK